MSGDIMVMNDSHLEMCAKVMPLRESVELEKKKKIKMRKKCELMVELRAGW